MRWLSSLLFSLKSLFRRGKLEDQISEEVRTHVEMATEAYVAKGMPACEARYAALREFGNIGVVQERVREERGWLWLDLARKDFALAGRRLFKARTFTLIAVTTLALGIGTNTAMFSLMNALVLRPLPFPNSDELVRVWRTTEGDRRGGFSPGDYFDLKHTETTAGEFAAYYNEDVVFSSPGGAVETGRMMAISANLLGVLQVQPTIGRSFRPEEEVDGNHRVVMLSHQIWLSRFGGAPDVIGRTIRMNAEPHEVVGVLPEWATTRRPLHGIDLFRPLGLADEQRTSRTQHLLSLIGRRGDNVSRTQFALFIGEFGHRLAQDFPEANGDSGWRSESLLAAGMNPTGRMIVGMLIGLSASVLLIACSNLANLLLASTVNRSREFAVRAALGASRWHLLVPLAWEAIILAATGSAAALLVCRWTTNWITSESARSGGPPLELPFDWRVLGFALTAAFITALVFGIAPALFAMRVNLNDTLKSGARGATTSRGHQRLRRLLIVGQFALAMVILAAAGYFVGGTRNLVRQEFGWSGEHVTQGEFDLPKVNYPGAVEILAFQRELADRLNALPVVAATSFSYNLPYIALAGERRYIVEGRENPPEGREPSAAFNGVSPDYFTVTGTRLLNGRVFAEGDNIEAQRVVIVSESFARTFFPDQDPIGRRIARAGAGVPEWREIVGVVADVRTPQTNQAPNVFQVYHPIAQEPWHSSRFAVLTTGVSPASLIDPIREIVASIDQDLPLIDVMSAELRFERTVSDYSLVNPLLSAFALLALGLAALGIYGVIARVVAQRTAEFGIRMALGAGQPTIVGIVLKDGARLAIIGTGVGLWGAYALSRLIASALPGLQTSSGAVMGGVILLLVAIALLASYLPARKAARIDPAITLRAE